MPRHDERVTLGCAEVRGQRGHVALLQPVTLRVVWRRGEAHAQLVEVDEGRSYTGSRKSVVQRPAGCRFACSRWAAQPQDRMPLVAHMRIMTSRPGVRVQAREPWLGI